MWSPEELRSRYPGIVVPAWFTIPEIKGSDGWKVANLCRRVGLDPDPEQLLMLDLVFAHDPDTLKVSIFTLVIIMGRQNGKSALFAMCILGWLFITKEREIVFTSHAADTAGKLHTFLTELIEGSPLLMKRMPDWKGGDREQLAQQIRLTHGVYKANGQQRIETAAGNKVLFKTRTKSGARGFTANKVILDEAFAVMPSFTAALIPTLSAVPNGQVLVGSSAGLPESVYLRKRRDDGRAYKSDKTAYLEWCSPPAEEVCDLGALCTHSRGTEGCAMDKSEVVALANPAMGRRMSAEWVQHERDSEMDPPEFAIERLGWWAAPLIGETVFDLQAWAASVTEGSWKFDGPFAFAIDVAQDESAASIGMCGKDAKGRRHYEVLIQRPGTSWVVEAIVAACKLHKPVAVGINDGSPAGALEGDLLEAGFVRSWKPEQKVPSSKTRLFAVFGREYAQACGAMVNDVRNDLAVHLDQPNLNRAVEEVRIRPLADAYCWAPRLGGNMDISPLVSVTLARAALTRFGAAKRKVLVDFS